MISDNGKVDLADLVVGEVGRRDLQREEVRTDNCIKCEQDITNKASRRIVVMSRLTLASLRFAFITSLATLLVELARLLTLILVVLFSSSPVRSRLTMFLLKGTGSTPSPDSSSQTVSLAFSSLSIVELALDRGSDDVQLASVAILSWDCGTLWYWSASSTLSSVSSPSSSRAEEVVEKVETDRMLGSLDPPEEFEEGATRGRRGLRAGRLGIADRDASLKVVLDGDADIGGGGGGRDGELREEVLVGGRTSPGDGIVEDAIEAGLPNEVMIAEGVRDAREVEALRRTRS